MTLEVRRLSVTEAGRTLVAGVDLVIEPGKVTAVIGANGAEKSELVLALAGRLPVTAGAVLLDGKPLNGVGARGDPPRWCGGGARGAPRADRPVGR